MSDLRILVIENEPVWQDIIAERVNLLGKVSVRTATNHKTAQEAILENSFDLALVDLALSDKGGASSQHKEGLALLGHIRQSERNHACGLIVVTGLGTSYVLESFKDYEVDDYIEKEQLTNDEFDFLGAARAAIFKGYLRQAQGSEEKCYRLKVTFGLNSLNGSELSGPDRRAQYQVKNQLAFDVDDLVRRTDNLNILILNGGPDLWRPEARSIGNRIYASLASDQRILGDLIAGRALARRFSGLRLTFSGPVSGLGIPFELLRDEDDYLGLSHMLTRQIIRAGPLYTRKLGAFHHFLKELRTTKQPLRILVVGANSDGSIPAAEQEATSLALAIESDLQRLGIEHRITLLCGVDASYEKVAEALRHGRFHIFHYAGHGRHDDQLAELSGLILTDTDGHRTMTADIVNQLVSDTDLRMVYLSCCLGARTAQQLNRGDFYGVMDAFARADIPEVIGYRWTVADSPAMLMAMVFYQVLWRTFSPSEALLEARKSVAMGERGRDDETWASPILLMQNV